MEKLKRQSTFTKKSTNLSTTGKILKPRNQKNSISKRLDRGLLLEEWRKEKGISKKEKCHPLMSRKRSLAQVVSSPSYKPLKVEPKEISSEYHFDRRKTFVISKENQPIGCCKSITTGNLKDKRKTIHGLPEVTKINTCPNKTRRKSMFPKTSVNSDKGKENTQDSFGNQTDNIASLKKNNSLSGITKEPILSHRKSLVSNLATSTTITSSLSKKAKIEKRRTIHGLPSFNNRKDDKIEDFQTKQPNPKDKRKSIQFTTSVRGVSSKKLTSPKPFTSALRNANPTANPQTPWRNESLSRRERLDLWLASKGKTPYTERRRSVYKSPHPKKFQAHDSQEGSNNVTTTSASSITNTTASITKSEIDCNLDDINNQLESILNILDSNHQEAKEKLNKLQEENKESIEKLANYWICKARVAALIKSNIQNVISLLEQACSCEAKPQYKIRDEICRYLQQIENDEDDENYCKDNTAIDRLNYAITPGRRVHFANRDSPLDFKSSIIRFCIVESTAFKRRLNKQMKRKIMTPVRRSARLRRHSAIIPEYLRTDDRLVDSPTRVEQDIIDGRIGFEPSKYLNTPLNKGWLVDEVSTAADNEEEEEVNDEVDECVKELSFLG